MESNYKLLEFLGIRNEDLEIENPNLNYSKLVEQALNFLENQKQEIIA